jgi:hypothetical protein
MSAVACPLAEHCAEAFARMLRVPQHDTPFLVNRTLSPIESYFSK